MIHRKDIQKWVSVMKENETKLPDETNKLNHDWKMWFQGNIILPKVLLSFNRFHEMGMENSTDV